MRLRRRKRMRKRSEREKGRGREKRMDDVAVEVRSNMLARRMKETVKGGEE